MDDNNLVSQAIVSSVDALAHLQENPVFVPSRATALTRAIVELAEERGCTMLELRHASMCVHVCIDARLRDAANADSREPGDDDGDS